MSDHSRGEPLYNSQLDAEQAAIIAADYRIRGRDAVNVALADQLGEPMITLGRQQLAPGAAIVTTHQPWMRSQVFPKNLASLSPGRTVTVLGLCYPRKVELNQLTRYGMTQLSH